MEDPSPGGPARRQFYVTHCATADSVLGTPGWSVRAATPGDPGALRQALDAPPYELPMDLWGRRPNRDQAPRRLARTRGPNGGVWVVHSAYLEQDTMGRDRSFFSHLLLLPPEDAAPAAVLRSWAADGWATDYRPGKTKTLPPPPRPADGPAVSDAALTAFLADDSFPPGPPDLSVVVCPDRLRDDPAARRALTGRFLRGVVAAVGAPDPARARLFVHAEPGLLALLLYGAVRLLPPGWAGDLTFTTFEPAHRGLREYKLADVVGTYFGNPDKPLDPDLLAARGVALNTFHPGKSSPELRPPGDEFADLLALAAAGEWDLVKQVHAILGDDRPPPARLAEVVRLARAADKLDRGEAALADLFTLRDDPDGAATLTARAGAAWPVVRDAAVGLRADARDPAVRRKVRDDFRDLIRTPARLAELRATALAALLAGDFDKWATWWDVVRDATAGDPAAGAEQAAALAADIGPRAALQPRETRALLRRELAAAPAAPADALFTPLDAAELDAILADPACPPVRRGEALAAALLADPPRDDLRRAAERLLPAAGPAALVGFLNRAKRKPDGPIKPLLPLLARPDDAARGLLAALTQAGDNAVPPGEWKRLVGHLLGHEPGAWDGVLIGTGGLAAVLAGLGADKDAPKVWGHYLSPKRLDRGLIGGKDAAQLAVVGVLDEAAARLGGRGLDPAGVMGEKAFERYEAARCLAALTRDPGAGVGYKPDALRAAFGLFGVDSLTSGLTLLFRYKYSPARPAADADRLLALFAHCYPTASGFNGWNYALSAWLKVTSPAPPETRAAWQLLFADTVPVETADGKIILEPVLSEGRKPDVPDIHPDVWRHMKEKIPIIQGPRAPARRKATAKAKGAKEPWWRTPYGMLAAILVGALVFAMVIYFIGRSRRSADAPRGVSPAARAPARVEGGRT